MVFEWKIDKYPVTAQTAGTVLTDIEKRYGEVSPAIIVDESREVTAPLHPCFEWRDDVAAERYREKQAQGIIQNIVVVGIKDDDGGDVEPMRAFVSVRNEDTEENMYISVKRAVCDDEYNIQVIQTAYKELQVFAKKYADIKRFSAVIRAINSISLP